MLTSLELPCPSGCLLKINIKGLLGLKIARDERVITIDALRRQRGLATPKLIQGQSFTDWA